MSSAKGGSQGSSVSRPPPKNHYSSPFGSLPAVASASTLASSNSSSSGSLDIKTYLNQQKRQQLQLAGNPAAEDDSSDEESQSAASSAVPLSSATGSSKSHPPAKSQTSTARRPLPYTFVPKSFLSPPAFIDPSLPPSDPSSPASLPLWKQQELSRSTAVSKILQSQATLEARSNAALTGTLIGKALVAPPKQAPRWRRAGDSSTTFSPRNNRELLSPGGGGEEAGTLSPPSRPALSEEDELCCSYVAGNIIRTADRGTVDGSVSINELRVFLSGTFYQPFMLWLTHADPATGYCARFHAVDKDGSQSIEVAELALCVRDFYCGSSSSSSEGGLSALQVAHKYAEESNKKLKEERESRRKAKAVERRKSMHMQEMEKQRLRQERSDAARRLFSDPVRLSDVRHKLLASSYTSFGSRGDLDLMFDRFDKDGSGNLDVIEFKTLVRHVLKVPPSELSDGDVRVLFDYLDAGGGGVIEREDMLQFLSADFVVRPEDIRERVLLKGEDKRSGLDDLKALINFKTKEEVEKEREKLMRATNIIAGSVPWDNNTRTGLPLELQGGNNKFYVGLQVYSPRGKFV